MKGGLVIMLYALQAFEKSPFCKNIGWEILINPDEEIGSYGSKELLCQCAKNNQLGLLFEPSFPDGNVVSSRGSSMNLIVVVRGKAAHVGRDFEKGKSAAFIQASLVVELEKLNNSEEKAIVNVGQITSGHGFNIVPDVAVIKINIRTTTTEHLHTIKNRIEVLIKEHKQQRAVDIELHEHTLNEAKPCTEKTQHVLELFKQCADALHMPFGWKSTHGVSDGNKLAQWGLPCIDSLGAIGGGLHTYDEYLETYSLLERSKLCALFLMKLGNSEIAL